MYFELAPTNHDIFHFRRAASYSHLKSKVDNILVKSTAPCVNFNIIVSPIRSRSHIHPSHSQTSSLSSGSVTERKQYCSSRGGKNRSHRKVRNTACAVTLGRGLGPRTHDRVRFLVDKDNLINYQLIISYRLLIRILTNQPTVDKAIVLSTNCR